MGRQVSYRRFGRPMHADLCRIGPTNTPSKPGSQHLNITIFGSGYVGLVTAACFAEVGNRVLCVDVDAAKVALLRSGSCPFYEPGIDGLLTAGTSSGRLRFTTDPAEGVRHGQFQFIAVGTPPGEDGSADLQYVLQVARTIGEHLEDYRVIVNKSTVPVGTADKVRAAVSDVLAQRGVQRDFDVVSNPEFLKLSLIHI